MAKTQETIVAIPALAPAVKTLASAYKKAESAQASIGAAVVKAAAVVKLDQVETFVHMVKAALDGVMTEGSIKVEATRIRRVLTCIIDGSLTPEPGATLRVMYNECPKDSAKGGRKGVTKLPNPANETVNMADDDDDDGDDGHREDDSIQVHVLPPRYSFFIARACARAHLSLYLGCRARTMPIKIPRDHDSHTPVEYAAAGMPGAGSWSL